MRLIPTVSSPQGLSLSWMIDCSDGNWTLLLSPSSCVALRKPLNLWMSSCSYKWQGLVIRPRGGFQRFQNPSGPTPPQLTAAPENTEAGNQSTRRQPNTWSDPGALCLHPSLDSFTAQRNHNTGPPAIHLLWVCIIHALHSHWTVTLIRQVAEMNWPIKLNDKRITKRGYRNSIKSKEEKNQLTMVLGS